MYPNLYLRLYHRFPLHAFRWRTCLRHFPPCRHPWLFAAGFGLLDRLVLAYACHVVATVERTRWARFLAHTRAAALPSNGSSSAVHRPNVGLGWMVRSYSKDGSSDCGTLRIVVPCHPVVRTISLIVLPLTKCSRRIRAIVSTISIPTPASN